MYIHSQTKMSKTLTWALMVNKQTDKVNQSAETVYIIKQIPSRAETGRRERISFLKEFRDGSVQIVRNIVLLDWCCCMQSDKQQQRREEISLQWTGIIRRRQCMHCWVSARRPSNACRVIDSCIRYWSSSLVELPNNVHNVEFCSTIRYITPIRHDIVRSVVLLLITLRVMQCILSVVTSIYTVSATLDDFTLWIRTTS